MITQLQDLACISPINGVAKAIKLRCRTKPVPSNCNNSSATNLSNLYSCNPNPSCCAKNKQYLQFYSPLTKMIKYIILIFLKKAYRVAILPCTSWGGGLVPDQNSNELYEPGKNTMFHMQVEVQQHQLDHIHQVLETCKFPSQVNHISNCKLQLEV